MSFPFDIGRPYPCGDGIVICTEWHRDYERDGEVSDTITLKTYGDIFRDLSTPPTTTGTAAPSEQQRMERHLIRDRVIAEQAIPAPIGIAMDGQTPIAPPAARTPACLVDALCRRGRFIQTPPTRETGA